MVFKYEKLTNSNPRLYRSYVLINIQFIKSIQVHSVNITVFNRLIQCIHEKN